MPTVRYTSDGGCYRDNEGNRADPDDRLLEVDDETAEVLVDQFRFELVDDEPDGDPTEEFDDEYPVRVESYANRGKCGHFDPDEMDDPCARASGWGLDAEDGPCKDHVED